jgi:hypothetical protein
MTLSTRQRCFKVSLLRHAWHRSCCGLLGASPVTTPDLACLVHPSWLHCFCFAPCVIHTPPFTTWLVHPSWCVHRFTFAPCGTQTPAFTTWLVHPSKLHRLCFAWGGEINSIRRMALCRLMLEEMRRFIVYDYYKLVLATIDWNWRVSHAEKAR